MTGHNLPITDKNTEKMQGICEPIEPCLPNLFCTNVIGKNDSHCYRTVERPCCNSLESCGKYNLSLR